MSRTLETDGRRERLPDRLLPLLYFGFAHASLLLALSFLALRPSDFTGFYYHAHMVAVVHLFTLGWISSSILGALYLIVPMALTGALPRRRLDVFAFAAYAIGVAGMVGHFWIGEPNGMLWSAGLVVIAFTGVLWKTFRALHNSHLPIAVRVHFDFAILNLCAAATLGIVVEFAKIRSFLPTGLLPAVLAHAHLAAVGWATMMVMAAGYRLLPMLFPSAMPSGLRVRATAWILEVGVLGLTGALILQSRTAIFFGGLCLLSVGLFIGNVGWMLRHPRKPPRSLIRPDWPVWQIRFALLCLLVAAGLGAWLLLAATPEATRLMVAKVYGIVGLVGFLTQIVIGVQSRILPIAAWMWGFEERGFDMRPRTPHELVSRPLQLAIFVLWLVGLPLLALAFGLDETVWMSIGASLLALATLASMVQMTGIARRVRSGTSVAAE